MSRISLANCGVGAGTFFPGDAVGLARADAFFFTGLLRVAAMARRL
jgi:hypothetical protein